MSGPRENWIVNSRRTRPAFSGAVPLPRRAFGRPAAILLASADAVPVAQIQQVLGVSRMVIWRIRSAYAEKGLDYALYDVPRTGQPLKYDTNQEAEVVALAGSQPPEGAV